MKSLVRPGARLPSRKKLIGNLGRSRGVGEPLFLAMCGVQAARLGVVEALKLPADNLALVLAARELRLVQDAVNSARTAFTERAFAAHICAVSTLQGGIEHSQLTLTLQQEKDSNSAYERIDLIAMTERFRDVIAAEDGGLAPVEPDILGEALLILAWQEAEDASAAILRAFHRRPVSTVETLIRCCQDFAFLGTSRAKDWLRLVIDSISDVELLRDIYNRLPVTTAGLRDIANVILWRISEDAGSTPEPAHEDIYDQAVTNLNLSNHLAELGHYTEALQCARNAVTSLQRLVDVAPSRRFFLELAHASQCLANALWHIGDTRASVRRSCRAIRLYKLHDDGGLDFAGSLVNLSNSLADIDHPRMALSCIERAVFLARKFVKAKIDIQQIDDLNQALDLLARTLNNYALRLADLDLHTASIEAAIESVKLRREQSDESPGAARVDLASRRPQPNNSVLLAAAAIERSLKRRAERGFTLIELSIVLVVIGLIVGGVLVGQSLVLSAAARAQVAQIQKFQQAVTTFEVKYGCKPGDCANATSFGFYVNLLGCNNTTGNGNGDGTIEAYLPSSGFWICENFGLFFHLSQAKLFFSGPALGNGVTVGGGWGPPTALNDGSVLSVVTYGSATTPLLLLSQFKAGYGWPSPTLTTKMASAIDTKIDDGLPTSGKFQVFGSSTGPSDNAVFVATSGPTGDGVSCIANDVTPNGYNLSNTQGSLCLGGYFFDF